MVEKVRRDFNTMNKTDNVNAHKISDGKNSANFSEVFLKKLAYGEKGQKIEFSDTMNETANVKIQKISGGKDAASLSEVSLKKPSSEIKMRTTWADQSVVRKPQEVKALGDRQMKNVDQTYLPHLLETSNTDPCRRGLSSLQKKQKEG